MRSVLKASLIWGFAGLVLAVFFFVVGFFTHALDHAQLILWPSSFALMALDNPAATRFEWVRGSTLLILTNFLLYFVVGWLVSFIWRLCIRGKVGRRVPQDQPEGAWGVGTIVGTFAIAGFGLALAMRIAANYAVGIPAGVYQVLLWPVGVDVGRHYEMSHILFEGVLTAPLNAATYSLVGLLVGLFWRRIINKRVAHL